MPPELVPLMTWAYLSHELEDRCCGGLRCWSDDKAIIRDMLEVASSFYNVQAEEMRLKEPSDISAFIADI